MFFLAYFLYLYGHHRDLHSFPTRRSSDLTTDHKHECRNGQPDPPATRPCRPFRCAFGEERSEEHTSELQSRRDLVCRLLLEKKKRQRSMTNAHLPPSPASRRARLPIAPRY